MRLGGFLGEKPADDKPKQAIYWRSDGTARSLGRQYGRHEGAVRGLRPGRQLLAGACSWIADSIDFEFGNADRRRQRRRRADRRGAGRSKPSAQARHFRVVTSSLSELFGTRLSAEFGLTAGFSSLDGD